MQTLLWLYSRVRKGKLTPVSSLQNIRWSLPRGFNCGIRAALPYLGPLMRVELGNHGNRVPKAWRPRPQNWHRGESSQ